MSDDAPSPQPTTPIDGLNPGDLFARARNTAPESGSARGWTPPSVEALQRALPQYDILALAGRGGMGAVYKGWQKSLERHVAIKVLPAEIERGDADFAARFKREAKAMARLSHPNIVAVHDAGETPDGLLYFVMDFIEGTDVQQMVEGRSGAPPLRVEQTLAIIARVCEALAYAHGKGIIHRDIKPSNVMVDPEGHVKVADFGLAKITSADSGLFTVSDVAMGTPDFMGPEARTGTAHVDHRADLYAVGVMLYQMLTGKLPHGRFDPPSRIVPGLDKRLDRVVDRALQPQRDARYSSAVQLSEDLAPVLTRTIALRTAAAASAQRSWKKPVLLGALALAMVAAALIAFRPGQPSSAPLPSPGANTKVPVASPAAAAYPQVSASGLIGYPAGVWTRLWPAEVEPSRFAQRDGEWGRLHEVFTNRGSAPKRTAMRDSGLRAHFRGQRMKADVYPQMNLRVQEADGGSVNLFIDSVGRNLRLRTAGKTGIATLAEVRLREPLVAGKECLMEFYALGPTLVGRVNGQTVTAQTTLPPLPGLLALNQGHNDFLRDVEVLNLDGLPEAEALKLIGIDKP